MEITVNNASKKRNENYLCGFKVYDDFIKAQEIVSHFFDKCGKVIAPEEDFEKFYGLPIAHTDGLSMEEYEEVYNDDGVITDKNAFDKGYMRYTLENTNKEQFDEFYDTFTDIFSNKHVAYSLIDSADHGFAAICSVIYEDTTKHFDIFVKNKDGFENIYELSIKMDTDGNYNGGILLGKMYDICGVDELAKVLDEIDNGTAMLTTNKGRVNVLDAFKKAKKI